MSHKRVTCGFQPLRYSQEHDPRNYIQAGAADQSAHPKLPNNLTAQAGTSASHTTKLMKTTAQALTKTMTIAGAALFAAAAAQAQIGSGWTQYSPNSEIQIEVHDKYIEYPASTTSISNGGVRYSNSGGVETYSLVNPESNRVERRYLDNYSTRRQLQADVKVYSPSNDEKISQIFGATPDGPYLLVAEYSASGGSIKALGPSSTKTVTGIYGAWVRLNTVHDKSKNLTAVYVNGSQIYSGSWGPASSYYTKYGCYGTLSTSSAKIQFKNVKMFK